MNPTIKQKVKAIFLLGILCSFCHSLQAQMLEREFHDVFGLQGRMEYRGEWPLDSVFPEKGIFKISWRDFGMDTLRTYAMQGELRAHRPHGKWLWQEADWKYSIEPGSSIEPKFQSSGLEQKWEGHFIEGKAAREWRYTLNAKESDTPRRGQAPNLIEIKSRYAACRPIGPMQITDRRPGAEAGIEGSCNEAGEVQGEWRFRFKRDGNEVLEKRLYERGILLSVQRIKEGDTLQVDYPERRYLLELMDKPLPATDSIVEYKALIGEREFSSDAVSCQSMNLLESYMNDHFMAGWNLEALDCDFCRQAPVFRRLIYPINEQEKEIRTRTSELMDSLHSAIDRCREGRNPEIARARSPELDQAVAAIQATLHQFAIIDSLLQRSHEDDFLYYERHGSELVRDFVALNRAAIFRAKSYDLEPDSLPMIALDGLHEGYFLTLLQSVEALQHPLSEVLKIADEAFVGVKQQSELHALENQMLEKLAALDSLYKGGDLQAFVRDVWVDVHLRDMLQAYAKNDDYEQGLEMAAAMITKMDSLANWHEDVMRLEDLKAELKTAYTYAAYNPYTGEYDIELGVKNRFRKNMSELVIPYAREEILAADSWELFEARLLRLSDLRKQLIRFAFMDERSDRKIERRLRRDERPEKILQNFLGYMEGR